MSAPMWPCTWCGGAAEDEESLRDHQEWCLGDARANTRMLDEVVAQFGEIRQEELVAAARKRRSGDGAAKRRKN